MGGQLVRYRLGKKLARPGAVKVAFKDIADPYKLPDPPDEFGHERLVSNWGMLANDRIGDCAVAGPLHAVMLWNKEAGRTVTVDDTCAVKNYSDITGYEPGPELDPDVDPTTVPPNPTDQGTDVPIMLNYWRTAGLLDSSGNRHKIGAFVSLEPGNWEQLVYALYYFDGVALGLQLPSQWQDAFAAGEPWDALADPNVEGGHFVLGVALRDNMASVVTWGGIAPITQLGYEQASDETFALLTEEKLVNGVDLEGLSLTQLRADLPKLSDVG